MSLIKEANGEKYVLLRDLLDNVPWSYFVYPAEYLPADHTMLPQQNKRPTPVLSLEQTFPDNQLNHQRNSVMSVELPAYLRPERDDPASILGISRHETMHVHYVGEGLPLRFRLFAGGGCFSVDTLQAISLHTTLGIGSNHQSVQIVMLFDDEHFVRACSSFCNLSNITYRHREKTGSFLRGESPGVNYEEMLTQLVRELHFRQMYNGKTIRLTRVYDPIAEGNSP